MKPATETSPRCSRVVIFAQNGILAGDVAALLSAHFTVVIHTSVPGLLEALKTPAQSLLLVGNDLDQALPQPEVILEATGKNQCPVAVIGHWWGAQAGVATVWPEIPAPDQLYQTILTSR